MAISSEHTTNVWWQRVRPRLVILYVIIVLTLLIISAIGHIRLLSEVGHAFGGFFWSIDSDGQVLIVSTPPQLTPFVISDSLTSTDHIIGVNAEGTSRQSPAVATCVNQQKNVPVSTTLTCIYEHVNPGDTITYTIQHNDTTLLPLKRPAATFTWDMWWQSYGLTLLAGICWLLVGTILLATARDWVGAVEGITLLPPAMLFLLYSHWGNVQQAYPEDIVFQLLWVPSFALLGAAFIHLSLTYRPDAMSTTRTPRLTVDGLPYLPLIALAAFEWSSYLIKGDVPTRLHFLFALGYGVFGGALSLCIGFTWLLRVSHLLPGARISDKVRRRLGDLLTLWIGGVGLGFGFGILPLLLIGQTLLPLQIFYVLAAVYPLLLLYAIHSLRLIDQLQASLEQRETTLREQQKTAEALLQANRELQQATSLLLHADAHLRSLLSQRIHDQPKQQALRIRSLLGYWQHKLKVEAEHDRSGKVAVQPISEALSKVRKISEELESDLRGLQLLVEDAYQRRSLGLKLHLEKLIREDLPALHTESPLQVQWDLRALDALGPNLEQTEDGAKIAEAISYTVTQALLNIYNHAGASFATIRTVRTNGNLEVYIIDDGRGFDPSAISPEKTSLFKARLKAREAGGILGISSVPRPQAHHGTSIMLRLPIPQAEQRLHSGPLPEPLVPETRRPLLPRPKNEA